MTAAFISVPALFTPFIVVGGILLGWFTATESAAAAVLYAAVLSIFFYREMDRHHLWTALLGDRQALGHRAVLRRHGLGIRLAARLFPDPEGAARKRHVVGPRPDRRRLLHRLRVPRRRLFPRCDSRHHHRRHHAAAARRVGEHASGVVRDHRDRLRSLSGWSRRRTGCAL